MSAFNFVSDMHDVALKPRLLRGLLKDYVPDVKRAFRKPSDLTHVVYMVETHRLLSEQFTDSMDSKLVNDWKSAVDSWVDRVLALASTNAPDKSWAGICLLGLTCKHCSSTRFLQSYSVWFQKLLSNIQLPAGSQFVKIASSSSISDVFVRLSQWPHVKKEGTLLAGKVIQPILKLLNEDCSDTVSEGAIHLLCKILADYPSSVHRHYDSVETSVVSKILSGKFCNNASKNLARCLALLPKAKGDSDTWSLTMQKILYFLNIHINDAFQGLEDDAKCDEVVRLLVPPGEGPPPPLGDPRTEQLSVLSFSTLMLCCSMLLTGSYPVQVKVPIQPLLAFIKRVLMVNGSVPHTSLPFITAMQQEVTCSELPVLHASSLDLLISLLDGIRSQLLPYTGCILRLMKELFKRCMLPELRIKVYLITTILLESMGAGAAMFIQNEVVKNAFVDLKPICQDSYYPYSIARSKAHTGALMQPCQKKRKHNTEEQESIQGISSEVPRDNMENCLMIAALKALEALFHVGGAWESERSEDSGSRLSKLDQLLIAVVRSVSKFRRATLGNDWIPNEPASVKEDLKVAAFRTLLACLLSRPCARSPHLAEVLELFNRGKRESGTKLSQLCSDGLLTLEVLIHPRTLSLMNWENCGKLIGEEHNIRESKQNTSQQRNAPFYGGIVEMGPTGADDVSNDACAEFLNLSNEAQAPMTNIVETLENSSGVAEYIEKRKLRPSSAVSDLMNRDGQDEVMVDTEYQEPSTKFQKPATSERIAVSDGTSVNSQFENDAVLRSDEVAAVGAQTTSNFEQNVELASKLDDELSDDFPDIVDADPDSDQDSELDLE